MRPDRPKATSVSVALLVAAHTMGLAQMISLSATLDVPPWMPFGALTVLYAMLVFLIMMLLRGSQLARTIYTVVGGLGLVSTARVANQLDMVSRLIVAAKLVALMLLYLPSSSRWFAYKSADPPSIRRQA